MAGESDLPITAVPYTFVPPMTQMAGTDTTTKLKTYYLVDANGIIYEQYMLGIPGGSGGSWESWEGIFYPPDLAPDSTVLPVAPDPSKSTIQTTQEIGQGMQESGMFKDKSIYITIGDEPVGGSGVVDFSSLMAPADYSNLSQLLTLMPRQNLWDFFFQNIWPGLPNTSMFPDLTVGNLVTNPVTGGSPHIKKPYEDMVWAAFIDVFNQANSAYCTQNNLQPWDWETQKTEALYTSQNQAQLTALEQNASVSSDALMDLDPQAQAIMQAYQALPPLGDLGLEISRQNAVKELLKMKEYDTAQAIVDAYQYAQDTVIGPQLNQGVPYNIVTQDGAVVVSATPPDQVLTASSGAGS